MASFTETATLQVKDEATAQIKTINAALKSLFKTISKIESKSATIEIKTKGLAQASTMVAKMAHDLNSMKGGGGAFAGIGNVARQISQMQKQAAQMRQQAAQLRSQGSRMGGGGGGGGHGGGRVGRFIAGGAQGVASGVMNLSATSVHSLAYAMGRAVVDNTKKGIDDSDIGDTSLKLKQLDRTMFPGAEAIAQSSIRYEQLNQGRIHEGTGGAFYNVGQRTKAFSEAYGVTRDIDSAAKLSTNMEELTRLAVANGRSFKNAQDDAVNYIKALESMGRLTDKGTGDFNPEKARKSFEFLNKLAPSIGEEFTGSFVRSISKYLAASKYPISDRGFGAVLMLGEEIGTRAAVGYNQAVKQFSGVGLKKENKKALKEAGLLKEQTATETYKDRRGRTRTRTVSKGMTAKNQHLLDEDFPKWVADEAVPAMQEEIRKQALKSGKSVAEADKLAKAAASDPEVIKKYANKWLGERTAQEAFGSFAYRSKEQQAALDEAEKRDGSTAEMRRLTANSVRAATQGLQNQFQGVMGEAVMTFAPTLTRGMNTASKKMSELAVGIDSGEINTGQAAIAAAAIAGSVALTSGLVAMASKDPATAALGGAALALDGSAALLDGAAVALAAAAGKDLLNGLPGAPEVGGGKSGPKTGTGSGTGSKTTPKPPSGTNWRSIWQGVGTAAATVGSAAVSIAKFGSRLGVGPVGAIGSAVGIGYGIATFPDPDEEKQKQIDAMNAIQKRRTELFLLNRDLNRAQGALAASQRAKESEDLRNAIKQIKEKILKLTDMSAKADSPGVLTAIPPKPEWLDAAVSLMKQMQDKPQWAKDAEQRERDRIAATPFPAPLPEPPPEPKRYPLFRPKKKPPTEEGAATPNSIMAAAASLSSTAGTFATTFQTGASQIATAGTTAASAISSGAQSAGAAYGAAAAAQIKAAVANVVVSVQHSGGGADQGNVNNANGNK